MIGLGTADGFTTVVASIAFWAGAIASIVAAQRVGALLVAIGIGAISVFVVITTPWRVRDSLIDIPTAESLGGLMLTRYVLPFEIASLLLTVALIGAIVIARED